MNNISLALFWLATLLLSWLAFFFLFRLTGLEAGEFAQQLLVSGVSALVPATWVAAQVSSE